MYYDDLPVWGFIGKVEKLVKTGTHKYFLFTHFHFELSYNKDKVIEINVSSDPQRTVELSTGDTQAIQFSYSVKWKETSITYDHRMDRYARYSFLPQHLEVGRQGRQLGRWAPKGRDCQGIAAVTLWHMSQAAAKALMQYGVGRGGLCSGRGPLLLQLLQLGLALAPTSIPASMH